MNKVIINRAIKFLLLASSLLVAVVGHAELYRVGPNDTDNGYPLWYQDNSGLALDLCIPTSALQDDVCLTTPAPGDPANTFPLSFPDVWPDELFWFGAEALLDLDGNRALLVQAIEAAFGGAGTPNPGGQISFARIRIRFDAPIAGDYTVKYPYGTVEFNGLAAGEPVFYTVDIGIGAPGDFSGAMGGEIGPFLTANTVEGGGIATAKPFHTIANPDGSLSTFLSDPTVETLVSGSPVGFNGFEISVVPTDTSIASKTWSTNLFALIGKVHTAPLGSPMKITSALYSRRSATGDISIDVHATAAAGPASQGAPVLTLGMVGLPSVKMALQTATINKYFGQSTVSSADKPNTVTVINSSDNPASSVRVPLVDGVTISNATFVGGLVDIQAVSGDASVTELILNINNSQYPFSVPGGSISTGLVIAPETVTVSSAAGGSATAPLVILGGQTGSGTGAPFGTGAPLAVDDTNDCSIAGTPCIFDILANDGAEADPITVFLFTEPVHGIASVNTDGTVTYTPDFDGVKDSFTYTVDSLVGGLSSNLATVSINPTGGNPPPPVVAEPDPEQLIVISAECRGGKEEWRIDGTSSLLTPHSLTIYEGAFVGGTVIAANVQVDNFGDWKMPRDSGPCGPEVISIGSSEGGVLEGVSIIIN